VKTAPVTCSQQMRQGLRAGLLKPRSSRTPRSHAPKARQRPAPSLQDHHRLVPPRQPSMRPTPPCGTAAGSPRRAPTSARTAAAPLAARTRPPAALLSAPPPALLMVDLGGPSVAGMKYPLRRRPGLRQFRAEVAAWTVARLPSARAAAAACCGRRLPHGLSRRLHREARLRGVMYPMLASPWTIATLRTGCGPCWQAPIAAAVLPPAADWVHNLSSVGRAELPQLHHPCSRLLLRPGRHKRHSAAPHAAAEMHGPAVEATEQMGGDASAILVASA